MRKYQYYDTGQDADRDAYGVNWEGQTFTPGITHLLGSVKLKLFRVGSPGTITVSIRATSAGKPTGGDLCSGTIDSAVITEDTNGEWYEITLGDGYQVAADTQYAIVVRAPSGDVDNKLSLLADTSSPTYTGGTHVDSSDSGADWNTYSGVDLLFEEWGTGPPSPTTVTWGNLLKSQISAEKIEEAITRMIQDHENDPDAHLEEGEALYSHKASEIIDHIAESIIEDKILNKQITPNKLYFDKYWQQYTFETIDSWIQVKGGVGADIEIGGGSLVLTAGDNAGDITRMYMPAAGLKLDYHANPYFQIGIMFQNGWAHHNVGIIAGQSNPFVGQQDSFGFYWDAADNKLYARVINGASIDDTEITGFTPYDKNLLRAEFDNEEEEIRFYLNGTLKVTKSSSGITPYTDLFITLGIENYDSSYNEDITMWNLIQVQDYY